MRSLSGVTNLAHLCKRLAQTFRHKIFPILSPGLQRIPAIANIEGHAGVPLVNAAGRGIGYIAILNRQPLPDPDIILPILKISAMRVVAELERLEAHDALKAEQESLAKRVSERTIELRIANKELAEASKLKDEFLATMSHELRTPLNAILGMAEILGEEIYGDLNEEQLRSVEVINNSGSHLLNLINDILDLSKIEAGKVELDVCPVSITDVSQASFAFVRQMAHRKNIDLRIEYEPPLVDKIQADERRLKQIIVNLLTNAVKFTPEGGQVRLHITNDPEKQLTRFSVIDTGIGIPQESLGHLFEPFVQVDGSLSRETEGTGLGLSLVKRLAELHEGTVTVESHLGEGSQFTVMLPWSRSTDETPPEPSIVSSAPTKLSSTPPLQILLAEDNEANIEVMSEYLKFEGHDVTLAFNGREILEQLEFIRPDLIIMDIQMPEMDGLEAMQRIRTREEWRDIPIIALTAMAMSGDRERCLAAGASEYLTKPIGMELMFHTIGQVYHRTQ